MSNLEIDPNTNRTHLSRNQNEQRIARKKKWGRRIIWMTAILVWGSLLYGAYALAESYNHNLYSKLDHIEQSNEQHVATLNNKIIQLQEQLNQNQENANELQDQFKEVTSQLEAVKEEMALAGSSLNASDETKIALSARITDLSTELSNLQKSIKKLEDAARVY